MWFIYKGASSWHARETIEVYCRFRVCVVLSWQGQSVPGQDLQPSLSMDFYQSGPLNLGAGLPHCLAGAGGFRVSLHLVIDPGNVHGLFKGLQNTWQTMCCLCHMSMQSF